MTKMLPLFKKWVQARSLALLLHGSYTPGCGKIGKDFIKTNEWNGKLFHTQGTIDYQDTKKTKKG